MYRSARRYNEGRVRVRQGSGTGGIGVGACQALGRRRLQRVVAVESSSYLVVSSSYLVPAHARCARLQGANPLGWCATHCV